MVACWAAIVALAPPPSLAVSVCSTLNATCVCSRFESAVSSGATKLQAGKMINMKMTAKQTKKDLLDEIKKADIFFKINLLNEKKQNLECSEGCYSVLLALLPRYYNLLYLFLTNAKLTES